MTARERFRVGQAVELTQAAVDAKIGVYAGRGRRRATTGTVTGFGRSLDVVRVRATGAKGVQSYHMDFWQPATEIPAGGTGQES